MNIEEILDDMDDLLDRSRPIPFAAHKAVIDADRMRELLNSAHLNIPAEIKRAKLIDSDCDRIINTFLVYFNKQVRAVQEVLMEA